MIILITKDGATKVPREVKTVADLEAAFANGFAVEQALGDGETRPIDMETATAALAAEKAPSAPPADDVHVAVGSTRFSDGELQTDEALAEAPAQAPAAAPAKTAKKR